MGEFVKVADAGEIPPGRMKVVTVRGERVAIANAQGTLFAFADSCTHDGGPLCEGELEGDAVTCPWHFSRFSIRTGEVIDSPAHEPVRTYPVRVEDGAVLVGEPGA
jgi:3-phenylpropionate/trans-cinnamate dioxygenase ferredoxin subunit